MTSFPQADLNTTTLMRMGLVSCGSHSKQIVFLEKIKLNKDMHAWKKHEAK
jgi:hypothetical protein